MGLVTSTSLSLRRHATNSPFSPTQIAGLKLWLKASTINLTDGTAVSSWADSSGLGNNVSQATGAQQPIYKTGIVNGKPIVRFDGVNDLLSGSDLGLSQPFTVCCVVKASSGGIFQDIVDQGVPSATVHNSNNFAMYAGNTVDGSTNIIGAFHTFIGIYNGASSTGYTNGNSDISGDVGAFNTSGLTIGNNAGATSSFTGDIAEVLIYNSALSSTNRSNIQSYLKTTYGL